MRPRALERQGGECSIAAARDALGQDVAVRGRVTKPRIFRRGGRRAVVRADLTDGAAKLPLIYFNQAWQHERLRQDAEAGHEVEFYGRIVETSGGPTLSSPKRATAERPLPDPGSIHPVYALTDGIGQDFLRALGRRAVERFSDAIAEPLPAELLRRLELPSLREAVREQSQPSSEAAFERARRRLAFERMLALQASFEEARRARAARRARVCAPAPARVERLLQRLPHRPTGAQVRVVGEITADLRRPRPMRRLLQGDVGSGKTLVAACAVAAVLETGGQAALLAPTELLAEQHYLGLSPWFEGLGERVVLLKGSLPTPERRARMRACAAGEVGLAIGTHALFSNPVRFKQLDLCVIDEQQRFGVAQKEALLDKGVDAHALLMTATPIPRTLALALYGDLDVSLLDEKPPGRGEVKTRIVSSEQRGRMLGFLARRMALGERVFWVCPRIEAAAAGSSSSTASADSAAAGESEEETAAAEAAFAGLAGGSLGRFGVELVHGRVDPEERARRVERFRRGEARLLVGTSIVEVGVDVPEATVMVIEGAERFGLSQLHQLRGRVGRGRGEAWCFLLGKHAALERMRLLEQTCDGFAIAEEDLVQRGMGDLDGVRQSGACVEELSDSFAERELVLAARALISDRADLRDHYLRRGARAPAVV